MSEAVKNIRKIVNKMKSLEAQGEYKLRTESFEKQRWECRCEQGVWPANFRVVYSLNDKDDTDLLLKEVLMRHHVPQETRICIYESIDALKQTDSMYNDYLRVIYLDDPNFNFRVR